MPLHLAQGAALGFGAAASPGPFQAFLLSRASRDGLARSLPLALAPLASDGPIVAAVLLVLVRAPPGLLRALQVAGGAFLLWIAWGTVRALRAPPAEAPPPEPMVGSFVRAALVNALGPGPWVFWSTVTGPILVNAWGEGWRQAVAFLAGFYALLVGGNAALVAVFALAGRVGPRVSRALGYASAAVMLVLGGVQLWSGLAGGPPGTP